MSLILGTYLYSDAYTEQSVTEAHNLKTRDDDVFLVTYPRTGTTWTQNILLGLKNGCEFLKGVQDMKILFEHFPFIEATFPFLSEPLDVRVSSLQSPRFFKTHLPIHSAPKEIFERSRKIVLVLRNPKDCLLSCYNFHRLNDALPSPECLESFTEDFLEGKVLYGSFWDWTNDWQKYANQNPNSSLVLFYEDLLDHFQASAE